MEKCQIRQFDFPGEKEARRDLLALQTSLSGGCSQTGSDCSQGARDRMRGNQGKCRLDIGKITEKVVRHWHGLLRAVRESPVPEVKKCVDVAPGDMDNGETNSAGLMVGLLDFGGLFQP